MPDFELDRPGKPKPLVTLPRGEIRDLDGIAQPPTVRIFVELAKGVAGCCFCDAPIPKQTTRFCLIVALPVAQVTKSGRQRTTERYYAHSGCMSGLLGQEVKRTKYTCWDCGAPPPTEANNRFGASFHPYAVFTTSKFAAARLCGVCAKKPKWRQCHACHVFFPQWMVDEVADDLEARFNQYAADPFADDEGIVVIYPRSDGRPVEVCETCAYRAKVRTRTIVDQERADFEETRRRIMEEGVFGDD